MCFVFIFSEVFLQSAFLARHFFPPLAFESGRLCLLALLSHVLGGEAISGTRS